MLVEAAAAAAAWWVTGPADLPPPDHDPGQATEAADRILSGPEYQWRDDRGIAERLADWVSDRLGQVSPFGAGGLPALFGWLLLVALVVLVAYLITRASGGWGRRGRVAVPPGAQVVIGPGEAAVDWGAEAERCERDGRWSEALRARHRLLVTDLARRALIGDLVGRTAGELVVEVRRSAPAASPAFEVATGLFESAWYGGAAVGPADLARFRSLADDVLAATARARRSPGAGDDRAATPAARR